ncbi:MAG: class I adenylate-forming enzyme family protein [Candidatus Acidiferrales bacterium]
MTEENALENLNSLPKRISDLISRWTEVAPDRLCVVEPGGKWTYAELAAAVDETSTWLAECGVRPWDRVMIVSENCRTFVAVYFAVANLDAWPVLVNARLSSTEVDRIREHCSPRRIIYTTTPASRRAADHAKQHGATVEMLPRLGRIAIGPLNDATKAEPISADPADNTAALIYTSGTTGAPKGVMLTHRNLVFVAAGSAKIRRITPDDRLYAVLPICHITGLSCVLLAGLFNGATVYLSPRFDPVETCKVFEQEHITIFLGVPATFALLVEYAKLKGLSSFKSPGLRIISCSGSPLYAGLKADVERLFGLTLYNNYGITECSPTITQSRLDEPRADTSVGRLFPGVEMCMVGADQKTIEGNGEGELWVRGPNLMKGYYRAPAETASAIDPNGWFNTRDIARVEDGHVFIVGRSKDMIIRFGYNVYPSEVEAALAAHPAVARCAVIGRRSQTAEDEQIIAFVELAPQSAVTIAELSRHAAERLASYKVPNEIKVIQELPVTSTGKVSKARLAEMIQTGGATD